MFTLNWAKGPDCLSAAIYTYMHACQAWLRLKWKHVGLHRLFTWVLTILTLKYDYESCTVSNKGKFLHHLYKIGCKIDNLLFWQAVFFFCLLDSSGFRFIYVWACANAACSAQIDFFICNISIGLLHLVWAKIPPPNWAKPPNRDVYAQLGERSWLLLRRRRPFISVNFKIANMMKRKEIMVFWANLHCQYMHLHHYVTQKNL